MRTADELAKDHLRFLPTDLEKWSSLISDDMVWEFPFAADGQPNRFVGRRDVTNLASAFLAAVRELKFSTPTVHRLADEDAVFAEFSGESTVISNGRRYKQDYAFFLRAENGKISLIREYINPLKSKQAFS